MLKVRHGRIKGPGRHNRLSVDEDKELLESVNTFTALGCPLDRYKLTALTKLSVESLSIDRQVKIAFTNSSPGKTWETGLKDNISCL